MYQYKLFTYQRYEDKISELSHYETLQKNISQTLFFANFRPLGLHPAIEFNIDFHSFSVIRNLQNVCSHGYKISSDRELLRN